MYTEDEARTKWCPHTKLIDGYNRDQTWERRGEIHPGTKCIASDCMAWRWGGEEDWKVTPLGGGHYENVPQGFCGLAGKP